MPAFQDLSNQRFGRWTVLSLAPRRNGRTYWLCRCDCGTEREVGASQLKHNQKRYRSTSCGCYRKERIHEAMWMHGGSTEAQMLANAKKRAKRDGLPFEITLGDVVIPAHCPALGIPLAANVGGGMPSDNSPTIDKFIPSLGYVPGNVAVISHRANAIKRNATADEVMAVAMWMAAGGR